MKAEGWAVVQAGEISVETVSPSRTAAIVNWFVVHDVPIFIHQTNEDIERMWENAPTLRAGAELVEVLIVAVPR